MKSCVLRTILSLAAFCSVAVSAQNQLRTARVENVPDDYFGFRIVNPYRWMENQKSEEMQQWMRDQSDYADAYLQKLSLRAEILKRLKS